jgi:hypothetical protein
LPRVSELPAKVYLGSVKFMVFDSGKPLPIGKMVFQTDNRRLRKEKGEVGSGIGFGF